MSFSDNNDRHSFPHRTSTGYEMDGVTVGPKEILMGHLEGSILSSNAEDGVLKTRRKRREIRTFTLTYDMLETSEWDVLWDFYNSKAEHELYHFFLNLYYFEPTAYTNEWIAVNFSQKMAMRNFTPILGSMGIKLVENIQKTLTHEAPT